MDVTRKGSTTAGQGGNDYGNIVDAGIISDSRRFAEPQQKAAYLD